MAKLSESVMIDIKDTVCIFDKVGDGKLDVNDIINALRSLDLNPGSHDWDTVINDYHKNGVSRIDADQFASIYDQERTKNTTTYQDLVAGLKSIDPIGGKSGVVNRALLIRYMSVLGDKVKEEDAEMLVNAARDKDGKNVNIDKIITLVMSIVE